MELPADTPAPALVTPPQSPAAGNTVITGTGAGAAFPDHADEFGEECVAVMRELDEECVAVMREFDEAMEEAAEDACHELMYSYGAFTDGEFDYVFAYGDSYEEFLQKEIYSTDYDRVYHSNDECNVVMREFDEAAEDAYHDLMHRYYREKHDPQVEDDYYEDDLYEEHELEWFYSRCELRVEGSCT